MSCIKAPVVARRRTGACGGSRRSRIAVPSDEPDRLPFRKVILAAVVLRICNSAADSHASGCTCTGDKLELPEGTHEDLGRYCAPWDIVEKECIEASSDTAQSCCKAWCFVTEECEHHATRTFGNKSFYYSYDSCSAHDSCPAAGLEPPARAPGEGVCQEMLDLETTCVTTNRYFGKHADLGINDSPGKCCDFCSQYYPLSSHTDFFANAGPTGWCNCYGSCEETRCVSQACHGSDGGDVVTQLMLASPPPVFPPFPISPPAAPPLPPAPPLKIVGGMVVISGVGVVHACELLRSALGDPSVTTVLLQTDVLVSPDPLPALDHQVAIVGACADGVLCELSAQGARRIFSVVAGGALHLENLALRHGYSEDNGGALHLASGASPAVLRNCVLEANSASGNGGAVFLAANTGINLTTCVFQGNVAGGVKGGGAIFGSEGSSIAASEGSLFSENRATVASGGALYGDADSAVVLSEGVTLVRNFANKGGAVYIFRAFFSTQGSCTMSNNTAKTQGGGLFCHQECHVVLKGSTTVAGNLASENGGGLYGHSLTRFVIAEGSVV
eukprot:gene25318-30907_t